MSTISLKIEFGGGLELLFFNQRSHKLSVPTLVSSAPDAPAPAAETPHAPKRPVDLTYLIFWLRDNLLKERAELFVENGTVSVHPVLRLPAYRRTLADLPAFVAQTAWGPRSRKRHGLGARGGGGLSAEGG